MRLPLDVRLQLESTAEIDSFRHEANIIGISPWMVPTDYASRQHFMNKLDGYLQVAKSMGWIKSHTVVVFPEHIGTWLIVEGEKAGIFSAKSIDKAMTLFVSSNYFYYLREWFTAPDGTKSRTQHSIFSIKSASMARSYQDVFSSLARKYNVTIVAGSILLSNPSVYDGKLQTGMGAVSNIGAVFHPTGRLDPTLYAEAHPGAIESAFVGSGGNQPPPIFDLPTGRTKVLLSNDAWFKKYYPSVADTGCIVLSPDFFTPDSSWSKPWAEQASPDQQTKGSSSVQSSLWKNLQRLGMPALLGASGARRGMLVPLRGSLWDIGSDGGIMAVRDGRLQPVNNLAGATMLNFHVR